MRKMETNSEAMQIQAERKNVLSFHAINKPYAYAVISENPETHEVFYEIVESTLTEEEEGQLAQIRNFLLQTIDVMMEELGSRERAEEYLVERVKHIVKGYKIPVNGEALDKLIYYVIRDYVGYGKIDVMIRDPLIEDIGCNGLNVPIYVWHREHESIPSNLSFETEEELDSFIIRLAYRTGRMISMASPILDATLPDGSRIQLTLGRQVTRHGSTFTIRKFKADPLTVVDMIRFNTLSSEMAAFFWVIIENKHSLFVCGSTATGKTTLLNCFSTFILPDLKIVTIEDTPELQLYHKNWIRSVTRPGFGGASEITLFDLLKASMRQRPDYIIVGEIRGGEAYTLFQAMATGHLGMSTLHADSVEAVVHRLESEPMNIPRTLIGGLDIITIQVRVGKNRRTAVATEIVDVDPRTNEIITNEIFKWDTQADTFRYTGRSYILERIAEQSGKTLNQLQEEIRRRKMILEWMLKNNVRSFREVTEVLRDFYNNPEEIMKMIRVGA